MYDKNFIDACLCGDAYLDKWEDYFEYWNTHDTGNSLREFLGMTKFEYEAFLTKGDAILERILYCRINGTKFH